MNELLPAIQGFFGPGAHGTMKFITDWAGPLGWFIVLQLVFIFGGLRRGLQLSVLATLALATNTWLKWVIAEPRPFFLDAAYANNNTSPGFGMPSGHAQGSAAFWGGMAVQFWSTQRGLAVGLIALALVTGLTRNYLGVHSPAQVLIGLVIGFALLWAVFRLWPTWEAWAARCSLRRLWCFLLGALLACVAISRAILWWQSDFVVPALWVENYATATDRTATSEDLALWVDGGSLIAAWGAGLLAVGLLHRQWALPALPMARRWLAFGVSLALNVAIITLFSLAPDGGVVALIAIALVHPTLCLYLPLRAAGRGLS